MRILHVAKTSDGARWAAWQAEVMSRLGVEVHVALPSPAGEAVPYWDSAGAVPHAVDCSLPVKAPQRLAARAKAIRRLVTEVRPDLIHSHFVTTTMMLRLALGPDHSIPRVFQVPGPLHLEHGVYRRAELMTAGKADYWVASSRYTLNLYLASGVPADRLYLSYYGNPRDKLKGAAPNGLRERLGIRPDQRIVGNINYMYPPKWYLGQTAGLKRHEDVIDALGILSRGRSDVVGVLVGGQWGGGTAYAERLRRRASRVAGGHIVFPGRIPSGAAAGWWTEFDCAVHVPVSENCGGVVEPLASGIPTIASAVGGLPEVVLDGVTGWVVPPRSPQALAAAIQTVVDDRREARRRADLGQQLVHTMFDVNRTGQEIVSIYQHILGRTGARPPMFDSRAFVEQLDSAHINRRSDF